MTKKTKSILKSILNDIKADDNYLNRFAYKTLEDDRVIETLVGAGCPVEILDAMKDAIPLSFVQRRYCCKMILKEIKKIPGD